LKRPLPNKNDDFYESLLKRETERAEAQILLAEEQIKLTKLQQTKTKLQLQLLKARLGNAGLSSSDEEEPRTFFISLTFGYLAISFFV